MKESCSKPESLPWANVSGNELVWPTLENKQKIGVCSERKISRKFKEEKGTTEAEMAGWHHRLDGHEFE